ncbi:MAG: LysR family transcriptional regulator [Enterococcus sp.]
MAQIDSPTMLRYLDVLLKHGNYTKAAKDLYISQPYLTQTIKKAENELGIEIINRQSTPLQLTEAGRLYYQYLNSLEAKQYRFRQRIAKYTATQQKVIRIGILPSLGTYLLPLFLPSYTKKHPQIKIELHEAILEENEKKVLVDELDFIIGQNTEAMSPQLAIHNQGNHGYYAIIPETSSLYQPGKRHLRPNSLSIKQLLSESLILTTRGSAIRRQIDYLLQKYMIQPTITVESTSIFTTVELAKKGLGITFVPESVAINETADLFNIYPLSAELLSLDYFIAYPINKTLTIDEKDLVESFLSALQISTVTKE